MNLPENSWNEFIEELNEIIDNYEIKYSNCLLKLKCDTSKCHSTLRKSRYSEEELTQQVSVDLSFYNKNPDAETYLQKWNNLKLLTLPVWTADGFVRVNKNKANSDKTEENLSSNYIPIPQLVQATGWYISEEYKDGKLKRSLEYRTNRGRALSVREDCFIYNRSTKSSEGKTGVPILVFISALTGKSMSEIFKFIEPLKGSYKIYNAAQNWCDTKYIKDIHNEAFGEEKLSSSEYKDVSSNFTREMACLAVMMKHIIGTNKTPNENNSNSITISYNTVIEDLESKVGKWKSDTDKIKRFKDLQSCTKYIEYTLLEVTKGNFQCDGNTVITREIALAMDKAELQEFIVKDPKGVKHVIKNYVGDKISTKFTGEELLYAFYHYILYLNGIGKATVNKDFDNRVLLPLNKMAAGGVYYVLDKLEDVVESSIRSNNKDIRLEEIIAKFNPNDYTIQNSVIGRISDPKLERTVDRTNSLCEADNNRRITTGGSITQELREISKSQFGRVDPYHTPESASAGKSLALTATAEVDKDGFICQAFYKVNNGIVDKSEKIMLSWLDEKWHIVDKECIDLNSVSDTEDIRCTMNGEPITCTKNEIEYQAVDSMSTLSVSLNHAPLLSSNGPKRFNLAKATATQAMPVLASDVCRVTTGSEVFDSGVVRAKDIIRYYYNSKCQYNIEIKSEATLRMIESSTKREDGVSKFIFDYDPHTDSKRHSIEYNVSGVECISIKSAVVLHRYVVNPPVNENGLYSPDDIVLHTNDITPHRGNYKLNGKNKDLVNNIDHSMTLGNNAKILFKTMNGFGYEDSVQVSERFANMYGLAVPVLHVFEDNTEKNGKGRVYKMNAAESLPKIGEYIMPRQQVIRKYYVPEGSTEDNRKSENTSCNDSQQGFVIMSELYEKNNNTYAKVVLAEIMTLDVGDKISGWHGNKSTVSRAIPESELPYFADGTTPDIIFDPLGCIARENIGQLNECFFSALAEKRGTVEVLQPCEKLDMCKSVEEGFAEGVEPQTLYNPETGEPYPEKAFMGGMYLLRLVHVKQSKFNVIGGYDGKYASTNIQPAHQSDRGGQRISELETWGYQAHEASKVLDSMFNIQSDYIPGAIELNKAIAKGEIYDGTYTDSINGYRLEAYLRSFGLNLSVKDGVTQFVPISTKYAEELFGGKIISIDKDSNVDVKDIIYSEDTFGPKMLPKGVTPTEFKRIIEDKYALIKLPKSIIMPIILTSNTFTQLLVAVTLDDKGNKTISDIGSLFLGRALGIRAGNTHFFGYIPKDAEENEYNKGCRGLFIIDKGASKNSKEGNWSEYGAVPIRNIIDFFKIIETEEYTIANAIDCVRANDKLLKDAASEDVDTDLDPEDLITDEDEDENEDGAEKEVKFNNNRDITDEISKALSKPSYTVTLEDTARRGLTLLKDYMTKYLVISPAIFRPYNDKGVKNSGSFESLNTLADYTLHAVLDIKLSDSDSGFIKMYNNLYGTLGQSDEKKNSSAKKSLLTELTSHKTKSSVMRDTNLAKRVMYSGRSVITLDPTLTIGKVKIPVRMLCVVFETHISSNILRINNGELHRLLVKDGTLEKKKTKEMITALMEDKPYLANKLTLFDKEIDRVGTYKQCYKELLEILETISDSYPVLLERDPCLHKFSIQGFKFIASPGYTIRIHPLLCKSYNADFDGDQMATVFPQHAEAIDTVMTNMMAGNNIINPATGKSIFSFEQDMALGLFHATKSKYDFDSFNTENYDYFIKIDDTLNLEFYGDFSYRASALAELYQRLDARTIDYSSVIVAEYKGRMYLTTVGRLMYNCCFDMEHVFTEEKLKDNFYKLRYNLEITKSGSEAITTSYVISQQELINEHKSKHIANTFDIFTGPQGKLLEFLDRVKNFSFSAADNAGTTLSIHDFTNVKSDKVDEIVERTRLLTKDITSYKELGYLEDDHYNKYIAKIWKEASAESEKELKKVLYKSPNLENMILPAARGNISNLCHVCGFVGIVKNSAGEELPDPILGNYMNGLSSTEVNMNSYTDRTTKINTQAGTATTGYFTRRLVTLMEHQQVNNDVQQCNTKSSRIPLFYNVNSSKLDKDLQAIAGTSNVILAEDYVPENDSATWARLVNEIDSYKTDGIITDRLKNSMSLLSIKNIYVKLAGDNNNNVFTIPVSYTLDSNCRDMLHYRTLDPDSLDLRTFGSIVNTCNIDYTLDNGGKPNHIITQETIDKLEELNVKSVNIYNIMGCEHTSPCPRCFGYLYDYCKYPKLGDISMGYITAGALGESGTQSALDTHKNGLSSKAQSLYSDNTSKNAIVDPKNLNSNNLRGAFPKEDKDARKARLIEMRAYLSDLGIDTSNFIKLSTCSTNAGVVRIIPYNDEYSIIVGYGYYLPLWHNEMIAIVTDGEELEVGQPLIRQPAVTDLNNCTREVLSVYLWYTLTKDVGAPNKIKARNLEVICHTLLEMGYAVESKPENNIFKGKIYTVEELESAGANYRTLVLSEKDLHSHRNKILNAVSQGYFRDRITRFAVMGTVNDPISKLGSNLIGSDKVELGQSVVKQSGINSDIKNNATSILTNILNAGKQEPETVEVKYSVKELEKVLEPVIVEPVTEEVIKEPEITEVKEEVKRPEQPVRKRRKRYADDDVPKTKEEVKNEAVLVKEETDNKETTTNFFGD